MAEARAVVEDESTLERGLSSLSMQKILVELGSDTNISGGHGNSMECGGAGSFLSPEEMPVRLGADFSLARDLANSAPGNHASNEGSGGDESSEMEKSSDALIPGLPKDIAQNCLARIPWICQQKLITVCKSWAAFLISDSIVSVRSQDRVSESLLVLLSVPMRLGRLRLTVFDAKAASLVLDNPLAVFDFPLKWSGFLRGFRCAAVGTDLFIIGGRHDSLRCATGKKVWRFNFITRKWSEAASMSVPRRDFACAVINGMIYVAGGTDSSIVLPRGHGPATSLDTAEMYDYEHDEWHELPCMNKARLGCLGVGLGGRFYAVGGGNDNGTVNFELFRSAEVFDPNRNQWSTIEDMWQSDVKLPRAMAGFEDSLFAVDSDDKKLKSYDEVSNLWNDVMAMPLSSTRLPGENRSGHAERQQAMGGLPGDLLIDMPREGLFWMGPCSSLSQARHFLRLRKIGNRCWSGYVGSDEEKSSTPIQDDVRNSSEVKLRKKRSYLIIGAGIVCI